MVVGVDGTMVAGVEGTVVVGVGGAVVAGFERSVVVVSEDSEVALGRAMMAGSKERWRVSSGWRRGTLWLVSCEPRWL